MRTLTILRALMLAAVLSAPLAQVASAGQEEQQAMVNQSGHSAASAPAFITGPYDGAVSTAGN